MSERPTHEGQAPGATNTPSTPPVVDRAAFETARANLLVREKGAHPGG